MHIVSDLGGPGRVPARSAGTRLIASVDVEWSKNYRIKNGNLAFCYSIVWLSVPTGDGTPAQLDVESPMAYTSAYIESDLERSELVEAAAADIAIAIETADLIAGHQLCSDLAVLAANAAHPVGALALARKAWHERRADPVQRVLDTRFDTDHVLSQRSRRLVDVCGELDLDVTQPELARKSMTALHRDWLENADTEARERVTVLNLRHSLSTALVAMRAAGHLRWQDSVNVNAMISNMLAGRIGWLDHPIFRALVTRGSG